MHRHYYVSEHTTLPRVAIFAESLFFALVKDDLCREPHKTLSAKKKTLGSFFAECISWALRKEI
jgi:hypothetical protein